MVLTLINFKVNFELSSAFVRLFYVLSWPCAFWRWTNDASSLGEAGYLLRVFLPIEEAGQTGTDCSRLIRSFIVKARSWWQGLFSLHPLPPPSSAQPKLTKAVLTQVRGTCYCFLLVLLLFRLWLYHNALWVLHYPLVFCLICPLL